MTQSLRTVLIVSLCLAAAPGAILAGGGEPVILDLADVIGGGDGTGGGAAQGVDLATGLPASDHADFQVFPDDEADYVLAVSPFIDGVFVPDGGAGPNQITSLGDLTDVFADTTRASWDHLWNGENIGGSTIVGGFDYSGPDHSLLGIHANKGVTFDLDALESHHQGEITEFSCVLGLDDQAGPEGSVDFHFFLDGEVVWEELNVTPDTGGVSVSFEIGPETRFLTIAAADTGDVIFSDDAALGDPRLVLDGPMIDTPDANVIAVYVPDSPDTLVGFNTLDPDGVDIGAPTATLAGNFVRGLVLENANSGWYVTSSTFEGNPLGVWRLQNGVSTQLSTPPFDTVSVGGMARAASGEHLWYVVDPDITVKSPKDPPVDGPLDDTLYRIDFDGAMTAETELFVAGADHVAMTGLAAHPVTGELFAVGSWTTGETDFGAVFALNPDTGEATVLADAEFSPGISALAFTTDGEALIYATGFPAELFVIDLEKGDVSPPFGGLPFPTSAIAVVDDLEPPLTGDLDGDETVGSADLAILLAAWGPCVEPPCPADLDGDGEVGAADLAALLANWG